jgi:hypothetical protein
MFQTELTHLLASYFVKLAFNLQLAISHLNALNGLYNLYTIKIQFLCHALGGLYNTQLPHCHPERREAEYTVILGEAQRSRRIWPPHNINLT